MPSPELLAFNAELDKFLRETVPAKVVRAQRMITLELFRRIVTRTPVDTGRARGGWQVSVGSVPGDATGLQGTRTRGTRGKGFSKTQKLRAKQSNSSFAREQVLGSAKTELEKVKPFENVFISNNVFYVVYLEEGTPRMKARKFIARSLEEMTSFLGSRIASSA